MSLIPVQLVKFVVNSGQTVQPITIAPSGSSNSANVNFVNPVASLTPVTFVNPVGSAISTNAVEPASTVKSTKNFDIHIPPSNLDEAGDSVSARESFQKEVNKLYGGGVRTSKPEWSRERVNEVIRTIEEFHEAKRLSIPRTNAQYHYASKYEIKANENNEKCLIKKRKLPEDRIIQILPSDEYYDVLHKIHIVTGHGGREKMLSTLKQNYLIPTSIVIAFLRNCQICITKRRHGRKKVAPSIIHSDVFDNRGYLEIIDMQRVSDGPYSWILCYIDYITKFTLLRPLKICTADEIATELLKIFLEIGAPAILETEYAVDFTALVLNKIECMWPACKILIGKRRDYDGEDKKQGVEITNALKRWLLDNNSTNWAIGINFVQFYRNSAVHKRSHKAPFKELFGKYPLFGVKHLIPASLVDLVHTEEELRSICTDLESEQEGDNEIQNQEEKEPNSSEVQVKEEVLDNTENAQKLLFTTPEEHNNIDPQKLSQTSESFSVKTEDIKEEVELEFEEGETEIQKMKEVKLEFKEDEIETKRMKISE